MSSNKVSNRIYTVWESWKEAYKVTLTPVPYRPKINSKRLYRLSLALVVALKFILWTIAGLFLAIAIILLPNLWAIAFLLAALIVSPVAPIHWIAKLAISTVIVFPWPTSYYLVVGLFCLLLFCVFWKKA
ncbi:MAG: hypothetical protein F6K48_25710 [Okeania sp. SIO3H1]|uniref:hypothetical protein n=1 Tax=Okeania sp. SIO1I7 TaxID=2607772 RepID=UPI0013C9CB25|nr:hypothetical protein [Okeania sp. SIO1I7]NEN92113.1 hypothetical protein [Okeania sp. SIO3H1]NET30260.1 hypothetical protein [Okeania sp. SIO1I7]